MRPGKFARREVEKIDAGIDIATIVDVTELPEEEILDLTENED